MIKWLIAVIIVLLIMYMYYNYVVMQLFNMPTLTTDQVVNQLQPGDLLFGHCSYKSDQYMNMILLNHAYTVLTGGVLTHSAIVVQDPETGIKYVYDNYPLVQKDAITGITKTGPVLLDPAKFIRSYGGDVVYARTPKPMTYAEISKVWTYIQANSYKKHNNSLIYRFMTVLKLNILPVLNDSMICTENVTDVLRISNILNVPEHSNLVNPVDLYKRALKAGWAAVKVTDQ